MAVDSPLLLPSPFLPAQKAIFHMLQSVSLRIIALILAILPMHEIHHEDTETANIVVNVYIG